MKYVFVVAMMLLVVSGAASDSRVRLPTGVYLDPASETHQAGSMPLAGLSSIDRMKIAQDGDPISLEQLIACGLITLSSGRYALTEQGIIEAGRRFLDEFSSVLNKEDQLSCSDPNCDCQAPGFDGACRSVSVQH